jgi:hypothetical protein
MMIGYYQQTTMECMMIARAHLVSIDFYFFDNFVDHPLVLPNKTRE